MIDGLHPPFPTTEDDAMLLRWCAEVHNQYTAPPDEDSDDPLTPQFGRIDEVAAFISEKQECASDLACSIKKIRNQLKRVCTTRGIQEEVKALYGAPYSQSMKALTDQTDILELHRAALKIFMTRYAWSLAYVLTILEHSTKPSQGSSATSCPEVDAGKPSKNKRSLLQWLKGGGPWAGVKSLRKQPETTSVWDWIKLGGPWG